MRLLRRMLATRILTVAVAGPAYAQAIGQSTEGDRLTTAAIMARP